MKYIIAIGLLFPLLQTTAFIQGPPANDCTHSLNSGYKQQKKWTLLIKGIFDSSGITLLKIEKPVLYKRELPHPQHYQQTGKYVLVVKYAAGDSTSTCFDALVAGDSKDAGIQHGFFELQIPANENIDRIILSGTHSKKIFALFSNKEIVVRQ